jgi:hypothetical protein
MSGKVEITALLIGGSSHGAVALIDGDAIALEVPVPQKLKLVLPNHVKADIEKESTKDRYTRLTIDKNNRAIYVIDVEGASHNDIFVDYIYSVFIQGGK